ncbi:hypothetical protein QUF74_02115 [Candidatus Halobeggiatoa sp. HSG11]|nr:hypothetical protein [Candidatus Halobeggiatoa sp. HSG11]
MPIVKYISYYVVLMFLMPITVLAEEEKTPSHVYQVTENIISEIEILREAIGVDDEPNEPEAQRGKTPIHVYGKGLELLEKISKAQRKLGMTPAEVGEIPLREIKPADVFELVSAILLQLQNMKEQLVISDKIEEAKLVGAKMPSDVYENLWLASYMLDGLVPSIKPADVYRNIQYIHGEMRLIATKLDVSLDLEAPEITGRKRLKNIGQQALFALYKISELEKRIAMTAASVPEVTLVRIRSSDIYDLTNMLVAEMVRIKVHLKIDLPRGEQPTPHKVKTNEVFGQMHLVVKNLETMIKTVAAKK